MNPVGNDYKAKTVDDDLKWVVGIAVTFVLSIAGLAVGGFWRVMSLIRSVETDSETEQKNLHSRINRVNERAVQKTDLDAHLGRIETMISEVRREHLDSTKQVTDRLDKVLTHIATNGN